MSTWEKVVVLNLSPEQSCVSVNRSKSQSEILTKVKDMKDVREDEENLLELPGKPTMTTGHVTPVSIRLLGNKESRDQQRSRDS